MCRLLLLGVLLSGGAHAANAVDQPQALYSAGMAAKGQNDWQKAQPLFQQAAQGGHAGAQIQLGLYYAEPPKGKPKNLKLARDWLEKAVAQGHAYAEYQLARLDLAGKPTPRTLQLLTQAAEKGNGDAMWLLARQYAGHAGRTALVKKDEALSAQWLQRAVLAEQPDALHWRAQQLLAGGEHEPAQVLLSKAIRLGHRAALELAEHSLRSQDGAAHYQLGVIYFNGEGIAQDLSKAFGHFRVAAEAGDARAIRAVVLCYDKGLGVAAQPEQAEYWKGKLPQPSPALTPQKDGHGGS